MGEGMLISSMSVKTLHALNDSEILRLSILLLTVSGSFQKMSRSAHTVVYRTTRIATA